MMKRPSALYIERIRLERFRKYRSAQASFHPGVNVVRGPNEHGKSTVLSAILSALFVNPTRRNQHVESLRTWGEDRLPRVVLHCAHHAFSYVLDMDIEEKQFQLQRVHRNVQPGQSDVEGYTHVQDTQTRVWTTMQEAQQELLRLTGTTIADVWLASCVVRHHDLILSSSASKHARQSLQQALTASESSHTALEAITQIDKEWKSLQKGMDRPTVTPGPLKSITEELEGLRAHIERVDACVREREEHEQRIEVLQKERVELEEKKQNITPQLEASKQYTSVKKRYDAAREHLDRIEDVVQQLGVVSSADGTDQSMRGTVQQRITELEERKQALQEALHAVRYPSVPGALAASTTEQVEEKDVQTIDPVQRWRKQRARVLVGAGIVAASITLLALMVSAWFWVLLAMIAGVSVAFVLHGQRKAQQQHAQYAAEQVQRKAAREQEQRAQEAQLAQELETLEQELRSAQSEHLAWVSAQAKQDALLAGKTIEQWRADQQEARRAFISAEAALEALGQPVTSQQRVVWQQQLDEVTQRMQQVEREQMEREAQLKALSYTQEDLTQAQERIHHLQQEKSRLTLQSDALLLAREHLQQAQTHVTHAAQQAIQAHVGEYMNRITKGRYQRIRMNDQLELHIDVGKEGGWQSPYQVLSQGAQDQLALAVRIALTQAVFPDTTPPLFLDDPFGSFDADRLSGAMELVQEIAQHRQVFLFTHSDAYDAWADHVVDVTTIEQAPVAQSSYLSGDYAR